MQVLKIFKFCYTHQICIEIQWFQKKYILFNRISKERKGMSISESAGQNDFYSNHYLVIFLFNIHTSTTYFSFEVRKITMKLPSIMVVETVTKSKYTGALRALKWRF